jgi:hypothetical protein
MRTPPFKTSRITPEAMELAVKWLFGEVPTTQVRETLGIRQSSQAIYQMGRLLKAAANEGMVVRNGQ